MSVIVYRYGMPARVRLPDVVDEQLGLAHSLRNDLVTLQLRHEEQVREIWSSYTVVADVEKLRDEAEAEVTAAACVLTLPAAELAAGIFAGTAGSIGRIP